MQVSKKLVKIQAVVDKLENAGYYVDLLHGNPGEPDGSGFTAMQVSTDDTILAQGIAYCAPGDSYNKTKGTQIAFGRLMRNLSDNIGSTALRALLNDGAPSPASDIQAV